MEKHTMVRVAVDAMGGDNAPAEVIKGAVRAVNEDNRVHVILVGKEAIIREQLKQYTYDKTGFVEKQVGQVNLVNKLHSGIPSYR